MAAPPPMMPSGYHSAPVSDRGERLRDRETETQMDTGTKRLRRRVTERLRGRVTASNQDVETLTMMQRMRDTKYREQTLRNREGRGWEAKRLRDFRR